MPTEKEKLEEKVRVATDTPKTAREEVGFLELLEENVKLLKEKADYEKNLRVVAQEVYNLRENLNVSKADQERMRLERKTSYSRTRKALLWVNVIISSVIMAVPFYQLAHRGFLIGDRDLQVMSLFFLLGFCWLVSVAYWANTLAEKDRF